MAARTLVTNDERSVIYAERPVVLVGIALEDPHTERKHTAASRQDQLTDSLLISFHEEGLDSVVRPRPAIRGMCLLGTPAK